ncbi:MAG: hypothetical protein ACE5K1_05520 [Acidiferrobacterales bacterium]
MASHSLQQLVEEERLYGEYLRARARQALEAAAVAADAAARDPENSYKAVRAREGVRVAEDATAQLAAQITRAGKLAKLTKRSAPTQPTLQE